MGMVLHEVRREEGEANLLKKLVQWMYNEGQKGKARDNIRKNKYRKRHEFLDIR